MPYRSFVICLFVLAVTVTACKKKSNTDTNCFPDAITLRQIVNKHATIKLTGTINSVYIIEDGAITDKLIPCNFPMEFYQNDLQVTISGEVKATPQIAFGPCCTENFVITEITR